MRNDCKLFTGTLTPMSVYLATAEGLITTTKLGGDLRLVLTSDRNEHHTYSIPGCVYDPESPLNILRVPAIGAYFDVDADSISPQEENGTTIKSGSTKSHFFGIMASMNTNLYILLASCQISPFYVGHGYFNAFCTLAHKLLGDKVNYDISSAYSIEPKTVAATPPNPQFINFEREELDD